jgi:hypothetical protein
MVYQVEGDKFAWAAEQDNVRKALRGTGIIDYNGFKVDNSFDNDLAVSVRLGGAAEIKKKSVYWSDLEFNFDKERIIDDTYEIPVAGYDINRNITGIGSARQVLEPVAGFVDTIKFYARVVGTVGENLKVEIYNETDDEIVVQAEVLESSLSTAYQEVVWQLSETIILNSEKTYSIRAYRADNASSTDNTNFDNSNYYVLGCYELTYYGPFYLYKSNDSSWALKTNFLAFYLKTYDYYWESETRSTIELDTSTYVSSPNSLKWTYNDNGSTQYSNRITRYFGLNKQDWSKRNKVRIMFYPEATLESTIYVGLTNNGTEYAIGSILPGDVTAATWNVVEFDAPTYRDQVEDIFFYVDGNQWSTGIHTFYIDDIFVYKKFDLTAPATADYGRIDLVYIDSDGVIDVKTGTEVDLTVDNPKPEDLDLDELGLALISVQYGDTDLDASDIVDIRSPLNEEL